MSKWRVRPNRKRLVCLLMVVVASVFLGYVYAVSWLFGYLITKLGAGRETGLKGRMRSVYIPLGNRRLHVHHWLIAILMMPLAFFTSIPFVAPVVICGFLSGIVFQGIYNYSDWYRFIKPRYHTLETGGGVESAVSEVQL